MEISKVGVLGAGLMGHGIAQVAAQAGYDVVLREVDQEHLDKGIGRIVDRAVLGDHVGFVLDPFDGSADYEGPFFPFSRAKDVKPGHPA